MPGIVVRTEAQKPLTKRRVFETKLKGIPLCITRQDLVYSIMFLVDVGVLELDSGYRTKVKWPMQVVDTYNHYVDHLRVNDFYTVDPDDNMDKLIQPINNGQ